MADSDKTVPDDPISGLYVVGLIDLVLLVLTGVVVIFLCGGGAFVWDSQTQLAALHAIHLVLIVSICIVWTSDLQTMYVPFWFGILSLLVFLVDIFVIVTRTMTVINNVGDQVCSLMLLIFDLFFLFIAIGYMGFTGQSTTYYRLFGGQQSDTEIDEDTGIPSTALLSRKTRTQVRAMATEFIDIVRKKDDGDF